MGLFPPHYFHGLLCRDEMGRFASCLVSVVIVTFVTYFTVSGCLSLIQPGFSGAYDDDVNILPGGKIKLTMEFY